MSWLNEANVYTFLMLFLRYFENFYQMVKSKRYLCLIFHEIITILKEIDHRGKKI